MALEKKYMLARFIFRKKSAPNLVALVPQEEEFENGLQTKPPGMWMTFLPYADDIRNLKFPSMPVGPFSFLLVFVLFLITTYSFLPFFLSTSRG
jgi:hypothetical protein